MSVKSPSGIRKMSASAVKVLTEARLCIASAAGERGWDDTRQSWLARAARRLGLTYSRVHHIWYGRARLYADEFENMRALIAEQAWQQRRAEERLHDQANQISILVGGNIPPLEHSTVQGERAGITTAAASIARPNQKA